MTDNLVPPEFHAEMVKNSIAMSVSNELLQDSRIPDLNLFLSDPAEYRRRYPFVPPTRRQQFKTWIGVRREKLGERLYEFVAGIEFPDDQW